MLHARKDYNERVQDNAQIIPADEPVFLLRAQDAFAAETVRHWARIVELLGYRELATIAREHADKMDAWPLHKTPDSPRPVLPVDYRDLDSSCGP